MPLADLMTRSPRTVAPDALAVSALETMQRHRITSLPAVGGEELVGVVTMHALLAARCRVSHRRHARGRVLLTLPPVNATPA